MAGEVVQSEDVAALFPAGVFQVAIVVRDIQAAMKVVKNTLGSGEFRMVSSTTRKVYRGKRIQPKQLIAIADFGPLSIELIQPVTGVTVYTEFLAKHGEGVHHLGFKMKSSEDYTRALAHLAAAGFPVVQSGRRPDLKYDYVDTERSIGTYVELVWHDPGTASEPGQSSSR
jgi:methylmalonyl-CoA/ethylmalonyl-CoA epimerase